MYGHVADIAAKRLEKLAPVEGELLTVPPEEFEALLRRDFEAVSLQSVKAIAAWATGSTFEKLVSEDFGGMLPRGAEVLRKLPKPEAPSKYQVRKGTLFSE